MCMQATDKQIDRIVKINRDGQIGEKYMAD